MDRMENRLIRIVIGTKNLDKNPVFRMCHVEAFDLTRYEAVLLVCLGQAIVKAEYFIHDRVRIVPQPK